LSASQLVENFFRHEYGRMVAMLARRVGVHEIATIEDAVQSALMAALESWTRAGLPENPSAWLFRVAHNNVLGELRMQARRNRILEHRGGADIAPLGSDVALASEAQDDLLRMLFICCDEALPVESQLALALKTLCGFDTREIACRLFTTEANVYKRIERARSHLRQLSPSIMDEVAPAQFEARLGTVHAVLYLMFTEGHLSSHAEQAIRRELCDEAIRLGTIVVEHPLGGSPETCALLALMHLHAARMSAREDASGGLLLLEEQDRQLWNQELIHLGLSWLAQSAQGDAYSRYHAEAAIAAEHCLAPSFDQTRWDRIVECYLLLEQVVPSPLHRLNRAIATAEWKGPAAGLAVVEGAEPPTWLAGSYMWSAVLADLHQRRGDHAAAARYRDAAISLAPTRAVRALLERRLRMGTAAPRP
jgi:RNA polymerase sigma-70 factor (ECF subfamily)